MICTYLLSTRLSGQVTYSALVNFSASKFVEMCHMTGYLDLDWSGKVLINHVMYTVVSYISYNDFSSH